MEERYPFIRFVVDAAPFLAGGVGLSLLLGGTVRSCQHGGIHGLIAFAVAVIVAAAAYLVVMVGIECLKLLLDIEGSNRERLAETRHQAAQRQGTV